jgi:hypothetical protein
MNFTDPRFWLDLVQCLCLALLWLRQPGKDAKESVAAIKGRVDVLEERMEHMPTKEKLAELDGKVQGMKATLESVKEGQAALRVTLDRIEQYLLQSKS